MSSTSSIDDCAYCYCCIKVIKWSPVIFILTIVGWSYYVYVIELCIFIVESMWKQIVYLIAFHFLFIMFMWTYWQTIFTKSDKIPEKFKLPQREYEALIHAEEEDIQRLILKDFARNLPNVNFTASGFVRYCEKCAMVKPDRAHHCSVCGTCILKMDHHCPWINNCIGFNNYKFFVLYLGYSLMYTMYIALTSIEYVIRFWHAGKFLIQFLFFVSLMFAISLISLFCYHCYLVLHNRTTLEALRAPVFADGPDKEGFDIGKKNNFLEVFGLDPSLWLIPIKSSLGNGYIFPQRKILDDSEYLLATYNYSDEDERSIDPEGYERIS